MKHLLFLTLLLLASLGAGMSSLAQTPTPTPSPTPTSTPFPETDQAVTIQNNVLHDGNDSASPLVPPLALKWKKDLTASGVGAISYPLIAQGRIIVTLARSPSSSITAFAEADGKQLWSVNMSGTYGFLDAAYDANKVFVVNYDGLLQALNAATGARLWSVQLPGQYAFTSPPAASNGLVFVGGAGTGGTLYAVNENTGEVVWTAPVENRDDSSPAVIPGRVFVSYACPQSYAFSTSDGQQLWQYSGPCEGGGGATAVVHLGKVYVRDSYSGSTNGLILNAETGAKVGGFSCDPTPAFTGNLGVYLQSGTLRGIDLTSGKILWSFAGDGNLTSAPLIVNQTIYIGSNSGLLYGLNLNGHQVWSTQVGAPIPAQDEQTITMTPGLGAGDGLLVVPTASTLSVYAAPSLSLNISTRADVLTGDNVLIGGFIITGDVAKNVIVRALGPSLPVTDHLVDPTLELHGSKGIIATNDNWKINDTTKQSQEAEVRATTIAPTNDYESAIVALLDPGSYTAIIRGKNGGTGVGLAEVYDLTAANGSALANISTRGFVDTGDNVMIGGFIIGPSGTPGSAIVVRALGPSLGISGELPDPELDLRNANGVRIALNDNWADDSSQAEIVSENLQPKNALESALIRTLPPGAYTVIVSGHNGVTGIGLVEVYNIGSD